MEGGGVARFLRHLVWSEAAAETRHRLPGWLLTRDPRRSTPDRKGVAHEAPRTPCPAVTLGGRPSPSNRVMAAATPLSNHRTARCRTLRYCFADTTFID